MTFAKATMAALAASLLAFPAYAQNVNANNLVNVNISDIAVDLADLLDVNVEDIQALAVVQLPINVAANVCDVAVNVLARQIKDGAQCDAANTSDAVVDAVASQL